MFSSPAKEGLPPASFMRADTTTLLQGHKGDGGSGKGTEGRGRGRAIGMARWLRGQIEPLLAASSPHPATRPPNRLHAHLSCATSSAARSQVSSAARSQRMRPSSTAVDTTGSRETVPRANTLAAVSHTPWSHFRCPSSWASTACGGRVGGVAGGWVGGWAGGCERMGVWMGGWVGVCVGGWVGVNGWVGGHECERVGKLAGHQARCRLSGGLLAGPCHPRLPSVPTATPSAAPHLHFRGRQQLQQRGVHHNEGLPPRDGQCVSIGHRVLQAVGRQWAAALVEMGGKQDVAGRKWPACFSPAHHHSSSAQTPSNNPTSRQAGRQAGRRAGRQSSTHLSDIQVWRLHLQSGRRLCQQGVQAGQLVWAHQH